MHQGPVLLPTTMLASTLRRLTRLPSFLHTGDATHSDRTITRRLCTMFEEQLPIDEVEGIHFYVMDGTVTVLGRIDDAEHRNTVLSIIAEVPGVEKVVDCVGPLPETITAAPVSKA